MKSTPQIVKPALYSNWMDLYNYPVVKAVILPIVLKFPFITPNMVTLFSFSMYALGSILLFVDVPYHLIMGALLIYAGYTGDNLDGQLARASGKSSKIGDYLDKVLDVFKIYIITISTGWSVYVSTGNVIYILLAFTACFFFNLRYYIKLETMFAQINLDKDYLDKSAVYRENLLEKLGREYITLSKTFSGNIKKFWLQNRIFFWVDEAEIATFVAVGALFNRLDIALWVLAISQVTITIWRFYERAHQTLHDYEGLLKFLRK